MSGLSRRGFVASLLSSAAVIAAGPIAKVLPSARQTVYVNRTIRSKTEIEFLKGMSQRVAATFIYGEQRPDPFAFEGLRAGPVYSFGEDAD